MGGEVLKRRLVHWVAGYGLKQLYTDVKSCITNLCTEI